MNKFAEPKSNGEKVEEINGDKLYPLISLREFIMQADITHYQTDITDYFEESTPEYVIFNFSPENDPEFHIGHKFGEYDEYTLVDWGGEEVVVPTTHLWRDTYFAIYQRDRNRNRYSVYSPIFASVEEAEKWHQKWHQKNAQ